MRLGAGLLVALLAACASMKAPPLARGNVEPGAGLAARAPDFRLGPGDLVAVTVFAHPETSTPEGGARLDLQGRLDLPLVGPLVLGGLTEDEARARLTAELQRYLKEPRVSLQLLEAAGRRIYVMGEVEQPGPHVLDRPLNALQALSLAGGFRAGADRKQVALLRGGREALEVYFFDAATPGPDGLVPVQPDDLLFVRLSGAGSFRDQILPIVQSVVPPLTALVGLILVADRLNN